VNLENGNNILYRILESKFLEIVNTPIIQSIKERESIFIKYLNRYRHRPSIVKECLRILDDCIELCFETRTDLIDLIDLIVVLMREHYKVIDVQYNAIECLTSLTKIEIYYATDSTLFKEVIQEMLIAMQSFPNNQKLQSKASLLLMNVCILQNVSFNSYKCIELIMNSMVKFNCTKFNRFITVFISSFLCLQLTTIEKSNLGSNPQYMENLIKGIKNYTPSQERKNIGTKNTDYGIILDQMTNMFVSLPYDIFLDCTLSTLTNITDQSQKACEMFIEKRGADLCLIVLNVRFKFFIRDFYFISLFICISETL
jgi:hypothetical protein